MRQPIGRSETWQCGANNNNHFLNVSKTKELIVDYRKRRAEQAPINIDGTEVERVDNSKFLGVHITNKLSWSKHTKTVVKRARQHIFPLRRLKRFVMGPQILKNIYSCTIKSILTGYITPWYGNCSASDHKALQRVVRTAQYIPGAKLPDIQDLYTRQCQRKAQKIIKDSSHPSHRLFSLLPHGKQYWSTKSRTKRFLNSFYPQVIRLQNNSTNQMATQTTYIPFLFLHCCYSLFIIYA
jgi:hypothetical protein